MFVVKVEVEAYGGEVRLRLLRAGGSSLGGVNAPKSGLVIRLEREGKWESGQQAVEVYP